MCAAPKNYTGLLKRFIRCERGATAIEYALVVSGVAVAVSAVILTLGSQVRDDFFVEVSNSFK